MIRHSPFSLSNSSLFTMFSSPDELPFSIHCITCFSNFALISGSPNSLRFD